MRVLFFIHSLAAGGAERVTSVLANHWVGKGWHVIVVSNVDRARDFYELDPRIERIALGLDRMSANPVAALGNNMRRWIALRRVLKRRRPDVAVAMMSSANALLALAGQGLGLVLIGSERTYPPAVPLGGVWEIIRRWSYPRLSALVAQTEHSASWLQKHAPAPHIAVIPNPVSFPMLAQEPRISPESVIEDTGAKRILLAVGRLSEEKRYDRLLMAFARVVAAHPEWVLVILGEGAQRPGLEQLAVDLGVAAKVRMPGNVGNVGEWFDAADLFVLSSRFEGFPNTLLEALAHGLPAIAVDCKTGPSEIIRHEIDGLLVAKDDETALVRALERLVADDALRRRFGERAIEARERFALTKVVGMWEKLFAEVNA